MGMDRTYAEIVETGARALEEQLVPGAAGLIPGAGLIPDMPMMPNGAGMIPGAPPIPNGAGMIPDAPAMPHAPAIPNGAGMMPQAPAFPNGNGMIPHAPAIPDGSGMIPHAPTIPDGAGMIPDGVSERRQHLKEEMAAHWTHHGFRHDGASSEGDGYADFREDPVEPERERTALAVDEEQATAVLRVCRNGWNTIDTRAVGGHWFSA
jgi:hypothetical protein